MFPTLIHETLHAPDSHVHLGFFMSSGVTGWVSFTLPDESNLEDVELFADLSSCIGLGGETAFGGGPIRLAVT